MGEGKKDEVWGGKEVMGEGREDFKGFNDY